MMSLSYALVSSNQFKRPLEATKILKPVMSSQTLSSIDPSCFEGLGVEGRVGGVVRIYWIKNIQF